MANLQNEIYAAMAKNYRTSKEYASVYMETVYGFSNVVSKSVEKNIVSTAEIIKAIDTKKVIEKSNEVAKETHMAGNPIYNKEFVTRKNKALGKEVSHIEHRHKIKDYIESLDEDEENVNTL